MKRLLLASVAAALLSTSAQADIRCHMNYKNGNTMEWTFVPAKDPTAFAEASYSKNGEAEVHNDAQKMPLWTVQVDDKDHVATLASRVDPDWVLGYFLDPRPNSGEAAIIKVGPTKAATTTVAVGHCARLDATTAGLTTASTAGSEDSIPITREDSGLTINTLVGGHSVKMVIDTGATISSITPDLADQLIAEGHATESAGGKVELADGSKSHQRSVIVDTFTIGTHTRVKVEVTVSAGVPLLGLPILNAIGKFTIDGTKGVLTFG